MTSPPITTIASGFCTSAPVPVARAIGTKPMAGTMPVISTDPERSKQGEGPPGDIALLNHGRVDQESERRNRLRARVAMPMNAAAVATLSGPCSWLS